MDTVAVERSLRYALAAYFSGRNEYDAENDAERKIGERNQSVGGGTYQNSLYDV